MVGATIFLGNILVFCTDCTFETLSGTRVFIPCTSGNRCGYQQTATRPRRAYSRDLLRVSVFYICMLNEDHTAAVGEKLPRDRPDTCNYLHARKKKKKNDNLISRDVHYVKKKKKKENPRLLRKWEIKDTRYTRGWIQPTIESTRKPQKYNMPRKLHSTTYSHVRARFVRSSRELSVIAQFFNASSSHVNTSTRETEISYLLKSWDTENIYDWDKKIALVKDDLTIYDTIPGEKKKNKIK